jgi:hypothetical protein
MDISDLECAEIDVAPEFVCLSFNVRCSQGLSCNDGMAPPEPDNDA